MQKKTADANRGLLSSLTVLAGTLLAIAHTRLDLLSVDLEEELEHVFSLLVLSLVALLGLGIGLVLTAILLIVAFWDTHRLLALGLLASFFLGSGVAVWRYAAHTAASKPRLFAASLSELVKDRELLNPHS
jgi:uncharacterized membrane protein YqjE